MVPLFARITEHKNTYFFMLYKYVCCNFTDFSQKSDVSLQKPLKTLTNGHQQREEKNFPYWFKCCQNLKRSHFSKNCAYFFA